MKTLLKYVIFIGISLPIFFLFFFQSRYDIVIQIKNIVQTHTFGYSLKPTVDYHRTLTRYKAGSPSSRFSSLIADSDHLISQIKERCRLQNLPTDWSMDLIPLPKPRMLLLRADPENVLYASNPKTGCTNFRVFLFRLDGVPMKRIRNIDKFEGFEKHYQVIKYEQVHPGLGYMACDMLKMGVIRNPLTRLISGFRDKQLRKQEWLTPGVNYTDNSTPLQIFKLFVDEALQRGGAAENIHFAPQWDQMEVCRWPYDLLIPFEEEEDFMDLFQDITRTTRVNFPKSRSSEGLDVHDSTYHANEFYSQLNKTQMEYIYKLYEMDFKLLGYTKFEDIGFPNLNNGMRRT